MRRWPLGVGGWRVVKTKPPSAAAYGWNVTFNPNTVSLTGPTALTQSTVTVTAPDNVSSGTYRIGILGTGNGSPSTAETAVTVTIPGAVFAPDSISLPAVPAAAQPFNISTEWGAITSHSEPSWVTVTYPGTCKGSPGNDYACVTAAETSSAREGTIEVHFSGATANVFVRQEAPVPATGFGVSATGGVTKALAWTAYFPDGRTVEGFRGQTSRIVDRNGNAVSVTGYFDPASTGSFPEVIVADQVNRRVKISHQWNAVPNDASISQDIVTREYCSSGTCAPGDGAWQANQTWMVTWKAYQANYSHNYAGGQNWTVCGTPCGLIPHGTWVQSVALPPAVAGETARTYQFVYNLEGSAQGVNGWGELYSVTTPTGYTATYRYSGGNESSPRAGSFPLTWSPVTSKTASYTDGNPSEMWSYSFGGGTGDTTTVTAPDGSTSQTHYLSYPVMNPLAWKTVAPNGDVVKRLWYSNRPPNVSLAGQFPNAYLKTEYHFINASNSLRAASILDYSYDKNNNLLSLGEYDCLPADERLTPCAPVPTDATVQPGALPAGLAPTPSNGTYVRRCNRHCRHRHQRPGIGPRECLLGIDRSPAAQRQAQQECDRERDRTLFRVHLRRRARAREPDPGTGLRRQQRDPAVQGRLRHLRQRNEPLRRKRQYHALRVR